MANADCQIEAPQPPISVEAKTRLPPISSQQAAIVLLVSIRNAPAAQVVRRHLNTYSIPNQNPDPILSHLAGDGCKHYVLAVVEAHFKEGVRLLVDNGAFRRNQVFCCQFVCSLVISPLWFVSGQLRHGVLYFELCALSKNEAKHNEQPATDN